MSSVFEMTSLACSGVATGTPAGDAALNRVNVFELTQAAEDAVLAPVDAGAWPAETRAAFAVRIAKLNRSKTLVAQYGRRPGGDGPLADPANDGTAQNMGVVVTFMDKVAAQTREVRANDITSLQAAGVSDADIVRLAELNAFLAFQIRMVAGLSLIKGDIA
ncbi:hypothetical protein OAN307_c17970 [Octadecabacter antarcticus 307]|uniref:CMD domain protein n=2 Tax=Octadecabacter TaxID=53945 RepID=M9R6T9_9RHOB|nr:hypothetical protein OAN307_c17970 [Octadecabacter antarcticus 307]